MKDNILQKMISNVLRKTADDIDAGVYSCEEQDILHSLDALSNLNSQREFSKEEACKYLNMSRSTFDTNIRNGIIPKGQKRLGFKELSWTKADLEKAIVESQRTINN